MWILLFFLQECDFQTYKNLVIPPNCVRIDKGKIIGIKELQNDDWEPLIIFGLYFKFILFNKFFIFIYLLKKT